MTRVLYRHFGPMLSMSIKGHAGYGEKGGDVVCAGVSACAFTLLRAAEYAHDKGLADPLRTTVDPEGPVFLIEMRTADKVTKGIFDAVFGGLQMIAAAYPDWVSCEERGDTPPRQKRFEHNMP